MDRVEGGRPVNGIEFLAFLVNAMIACHALPVTEQRLSGNTYQIQSWTCHTTQGPIQVRAWRRPCAGPKEQYWGRMVFLEFEEWHTSLYLNQFGEVMVGAGAEVGEAYLPSCGS